MKNMIKDLYKFCNLYVAIQWKEFEKSQKIENQQCGPAVSVFFSRFPQPPSCYTCTNTITVSLDMGPSHGVGSWGYTCNRSIFIPIFSIASRWASCFLCIFFRTRLRLPHPRRNLRHAIPAVARRNWTAYHQISSEDKWVSNTDNTDMFNFNL